MLSNHENLSVSKEQRKDVRLAAVSLTTDELFHIGSKKYFTVEKVRDISCGGIGLEVMGFLHEGERVRIGLGSGISHVQLYGRVVWCAPASQLTSTQGKGSLFIMGIKL